MKDIAVKCTDKDIERFWNKVFISDFESCWNWQASKFKGGYGIFKFHGRKIGAHRFSLWLSTGVIPEKEYACHTCDNPPCVNPKHLFWGTPQDNNKDTVSKNRWNGGNAQKTHCKNGHLFDEKNTYYRPTGGRGCRACRRV